MNGVMYRSLTIDDYDDIYSLWRNTPGVGLNDIDDSREGIGRYLLRNPNTCFIAVKKGSVIGVILAGVFVIIFIVWVVRKVKRTGKE